MKNYIIVLKSHNQKEQFVKNMSSLSSLKNIPNRACDINIIEGTRGFTCALTEDEARNLALDPMVQEVYIRDKYSKITTFGNVSEKTKPKSYLWSGLSGRPITNGPNYQIGPIHSPNFVKDELDQNLNTSALSQTACVQGLPDGTGVDVVVVDGRLNPNHPEMKDQDGATRVKTVNWFEQGGFPGNSEQPYSPASPEDNHGQHVAGTFAGLRQGWAKNANIYNAYPYDSNYSKIMLGLKNWHESKSNGNPTITNHSYGYVTNFVVDIRYINSVTINGTKINAPRGEVKATTTATISAGKLSTINVNNGGSGYKNAPDVSFYGGGRETATATIASGSVETITVTNCGSGYIIAPTITFSAASGSGSVTATGYCVITEGKVSRIIMTNRGKGYSSPPTISFSNPPIGGVKATATCTIGSGFLSKITITNGGSGHQEGYIPFEILSGGGCTEEAIRGIDLVEMDKVYETGVMPPNLFYIEDKIDFLSSTSFKQTVLGGKYTSSPTVSFFHQTGYGPRALARISSGSVAGIRVIEQGSGFTSAPTVVLTNGGGFTTQELYGWNVSGNIIKDREFDKNGVEIPLQTGEGFNFIDGFSYRDALTDSIVEDLISSGIVFVSAAGNTSSIIRKQGEVGYNDQIEALYRVSFKENPTIPDSPSNINNDVSSELLNIYFAKGSSPSAVEGVVCVGCMDHECCPEIKSYFSNYGPRVDIYAPGDRIISSVHSGIITYPNSPGYFLDKYSGTSMASPQVAGAIACYAQANRSITPTSAFNWVKDNSKSALSNQPNPNNLGGGTDKVLYYPGLNVTLS